MAKYRIFGIFGIAVVTFWLFGTMMGIVSVLRHEAMVLWLNFAINFLAVTIVLWESIRCLQKGLKHLAY